MGRDGCFAMEGSGTALNDVRENWFNGDSMISSECAGEYSRGELERVLVRFGGIRYVSVVY